MIKGMIFDLDGTLIDSMGVWGQIDVEFLGKRGLSVPPDYLQKITPMGFLNAAKYTAERFGFTESPEEIEEEWLLMAQKAYAQDIEMKPGAKAFLEQCHALGLQLGIATSSLDRLYVPCLEHHKIAEFFTTAVTTKQVGEDKHSPKIYRTAAENMSVKPEECVVFEDILLGIQTAGAAGFYTVGVYEKASVDKTERIRAHADVYLDTYEGVSAEQLLHTLEKVRKNEKEKRIDNSRLGL